MPRFSEGESGIETDDVICAPVVVGGVLLLLEEVVEVEREVVCDLRGRSGHEAPLVELVVLADVLGGLAVVEEELPRSVGVDLPLGPLPGRVDLDAVAVAPEALGVLEVAMRNPAPVGYLPSAESDGRRNVDGDAVFLLPVVASAGLVLA